MTEYGVNDHKRPTWDEYFLEICGAIGKRCTCDRARAGLAGAVIAKDKQVLATGYCGSPPSVEHCDDVGHEMRKSYKEDGSFSEHCTRTTHAEMNAICQAARHGVSTEGATIYCFMTPCYNCAKAILSAGIIRVVAAKDYHASEDSKRIFAKAGVELEIANPEVQKYDRQ